MSVPNVPAATIAALEQSVAVLEELDPSVREIVLPAYMHSIAQTFLVGVVASVLIRIYKSLGNIYCSSSPGKLMVSLNLAPLMSTR